MSQTSFAIWRGEKKSQSIRPATLTYPLPDGSTVNIPCTLGNYDFFDRLRADGGGFEKMDALFIKILRADIPPAALGTGANFQRGQNVTVTNNDPDSPAFGEEFTLRIGENNSIQPMLMLLNLEKLRA